MRIVIATNPAASGAGRSFASTTAKEVPSAYLQRYASAQRAPLLQSSASGSVRNVVLSGIDSSHIRSLSRSQAVGAWFCCATERGRNERPETL